MNTDLTITGSSSKPASIRLGNEQHRFISFQDAPLKAISLGEKPLDAIKLEKNPVLEAGAGQPLRLNSTGDASGIGLTQNQRAFADVLAIANRGMDLQDPAEQHREAAEKLVATTLVEPILKQLREANNTPPPFGPGAGEKQFRSLGDAHAAREIVRSSRFELVDRLAQDLRSHALRTTQSLVEQARS
jgi:hypothetical protein